MEVFADQMVPVPIANVLKDTKEQLAKYVKVMIFLLNNFSLRLPGPKFHLLLLLLSLLQEMINPCSPNPCLNGARCESDDYGFTCVCARGYVGTTCAVSLYFVCV